MSHAPIVWPTLDSTRAASPSVSPAAARAALAERSLHEFFVQSWHVTTPGSVLSDGWHLEAIAAHLEAVIEGRIPDLLVLVPPRCGKTLLASICSAGLGVDSSTRATIPLRELWPKTLEPPLDRLPPPHAIVVVSRSLGPPLEDDGRREPRPGSPEQPQRA